MKTKAEIQEEADFWQQRADTYEGLLDKMLQKARFDGDVEYALRSVIRIYRRERAKPIVGTKEYQEKNGIPL